MRINKKDTAKFYKYMEENKSFFMYVGGDVHFNFDYPDIQDRIIKLKVKKRDERYFEFVPDKKNLFSSDYCKCTNSGYIVITSNKVVLEKKIRAKKQDIDILYSYIRMAQEYSDKAKTFAYSRMYGMSVNEFNEEKWSREQNYWKKNDCIIRAIKRAAKRGEKAFYDEQTDVIYFELEKGQVSFHVPGIDDDILSKYCICESHEWSGEENSRDIINSYFK